MKTTSQKPFFTFDRKLYFSIIALFAAFVVCFLGYQYQREKEFKIELLNMELQDYNSRWHEKHHLDDKETDDSRVPKDVRVTLIDLHGNVLYDSSHTQDTVFKNHLNRPEVQQALKTGSGYDVRRTSETTGLPYFYSATRYGDCIVRSALPYNVDLMRSLKADPNYLRFTGVLFLLLMAILYLFTRKLGTSINQQREEEQVRLKRQLTQNIAHELKTPVSSIQGYLETIVNNNDIPQEKLQTFLEHCYAQSNRLCRLLRDISVLTRMDEAAGIIDMEEHVDISLLVNTILKEVALELEEKQITVVNTLRKQLPITGNHSLLYSIFRNLTDNAIAYAGTHIQIHIHLLREDEHFYHFCFSDTGTGVPPEHLPRLFERFYRVDKGRSRKLGGTGLGLAIVKNAVIIHGGTITAKNAPEGGLEFIFSLAKKLD